MKNNILASLKTGIKKRIISALTVVAFSLQTVTPAYAAAISSGMIQDALDSMPDITLSNLGSSLYQAEEYVEDKPFEDVKDIQWLFNELRTESPESMPDPTMIPIGVGSIQTFIPAPVLGAQVGDEYVQSRYILDQIKVLLDGRTLFDTSSSEQGYQLILNQISRLYQNSVIYAERNDAKFGQPLEQRRDSALFNMVWPERHTINGKEVLVPIVYLTAKTVSEQSLDGHTVEFNGAVNFKEMSIKNVDVTFRSNFINIAKDFESNNANIDFASEEVKLIAGGEVALLSSQLNASGDLALQGQSIRTETLVHEFNLGERSGTYYGQITSIDAEGNIQLTSHSDITISGTHISAGETLTLDADGSIYLIPSEPLIEAFDGRRNGYNEKSTNVDYLVTKLSAEDTIKLIAGGSIKIEGAEIVSSKGHIELLSRMGIVVEDVQGSYSMQRSGKFGKKKVDESVYQTVAMRSVLDAGKGLILDSQFGDITLKGVDVESSQGATVKAQNGGVNLLMTNETDHYSYSSVRKGLFTTKTKSFGHNQETGVPNTIVGGITVEALKGVVVEYKGNPELSTSEQVEVLSELEGLEWMAQLKDENHVEFNEVLEVSESWYESNTSLSPAAVAVLTIAVAVAAGPTAGQIASTVGGATTAGVGAATAAGFTSIVTTASVSLANGNSLEDTFKSLSSDENLKSLAISMVTAGVIAEVDAAFFEADTNAIQTAADAGGTQSAVESALANTSQSLTDQLTQATTHAAIRAGVSTLANKGSLSDFGEEFKTGVLNVGVSVLGEQLAQRIGNWHNGVNDFREFDMSDVAQYMAHAATGCLTGTLTAEINESSPQQACTYGAGGAVIGEATADIYKESTGYYELNQNGEDTKALLESELGADFEYLTAEDMESLTTEQWAMLSDLDNISQSLDRLKQDGADFARLSAAIGTFVVGAEAAYVNIAADTGENAAKNNALFLIPLIKGGLLLWSAVEAYQAAENIYGYIEKYQEGTLSPEAQEELLMQLTSEIGMAGLSFLGVKKLEKIAGFLGETQFGQSFSGALAERLDYMVTNVRVALAKKKYIHAEVPSGVPLDESKVHELRVLKEVDKDKLPQPDEYLPVSYMAEHANAFEGGAVRFLPKKAWNDEDRPTIGHTDGMAFVMPKAAAERIMQQYSDDPKGMATALGLKENFFIDGAVRVDIPNPRQYGVRVPRGTENSANEEWIPGGKTPNGEFEAVIDIGHVHKHEFEHHVVNFGG